MQIIQKGQPGNDHSEIDGIGARFVKMPKEIFLKIMSRPEFDWVLDSPFPESPNWGISKFIDLNPQFFVSNFEHFNDIREYPNFVINKDGTIFDLTRMCFVSNKMKGKWAGIC